MDDRKQVTIEMNLSDIKKIDSWIESGKCDLFGARITRPQAIQWILRDYNSKLTRQKIRALQSEFVIVPSAIKWIHEASKSQQNPVEFVLKNTELLLSIGNKSLKKNKG